MNRKFLALILGLLAIGSTASGLWLSGYMIHGTVDVQSGEIPLVITVQDLLISDNEEHVYDFIIWGEEDPYVLFSCMLDSAIVSADPQCTYEPGIDLKIWLDEQPELDGYTYLLEDEVPTAIDLEAGPGVLVLKTQRDVNSCPLSGSYSVTCVRINEVLE